MRIVHHFIEISEGRGGVPMAVLELSRLLAAAGHQVTLLTAEGGQLPAQWIAGAPGVPSVVTIDPPSRVMKRVSRRSLDQIAELFEDIDLLHLHGMWRPSNFQIAGLARRLGVPYVMSTHGTLDDWSMGQSPFRKRIYYRLLERRNLAGSRAVHATAHGEADETRMWVPHGRVTVIPCAFDPAPYLEPPVAGDFGAEGWGVEDGRPTVLFVGRLQPSKGIEILIDAVALLRRRGIDCQLLVAGLGDPDYTRVLRERAARHAEDTRFLGLVTGPEKVALYKFADVMALPSSHENFGLVIPEALAAGTPVVTTKGVFIWRELAEGGSSLVVDRSAEAFAAALGDLLCAEGRRRELGVHGREWVLDWLDPRKIAGLYEDFYREAVAG